MISHDENDLVIGPKTLWAEARGEPLAGQEAVTWVILNRATRAAYAGSLHGQPGAIAKVCLAPWQFSCWNEGAESQRAPLLVLAQDEYAHQYDIMRDAIEGLSADPTGGADSYFTVSRPPDVGSWPPSWAKSMRYCGQFGRQLFYDGSHGPSAQHRTLFLGCQPGDDVKTLQNALIVKGCYFGAGSEAFDQSTETAVEEYQRRVGLVVDGVAGPKTFSSLGLYNGG